DCVAPNGVDQINSAHFGRLILLDPHAFMVEPFADSHPFNETLWSIIPDAFPANAVEGVGVHVYAVHFDAFVEMLKRGSADSARPMVAISGINIDELPRFFLYRSRPNAFENWWKQFVDDLLSLQQVAVVLFGIRAFLVGIADVGRS